MSYLLIYQKALENYLRRKNSKRYFILFNRLRSRNGETKVLRSLRRKLENDASEEQIEAIKALKIHLHQHKNNVKSHSFESYLLRELKQQLPPEVWQKEWADLARKPFKYYRGFLFRGTKDPHMNVFREGLMEKKKSVSLEDYLKETSARVGIFTSKSFHVVYEGVLPQATETDPHYIYVIDYQENKAIDLQGTFSLRGQKSATFFSQQKAHVNVVGNIEPQYIVGAFRVTQEGRAEWFANSNYRPSTGSEFINNFHLPANFLSKIAAKPLIFSP